VPGDRPCSEQCEHTTTEIRAAFTIAMATLP
jgi:hypothetical protein